MFVCGVFAERLLHLIGHRRAPLGTCGIAIDRGEYLGGLAQRADSKEVCRHKILQRGGVVAGAEGGSDESASAHRGTPSGIVESVERTVGDTEKPVGSSRAVLALLVGKGGEDAIHGREPHVAAEYAVVAGDLPVAVGQTQRVAQRVDLPFALIDFGDHVGAVGLPLSAGGTVVESVGIRVQDYAAELAADNPRDHVAQGGIRLCQRHVWPHLGRGITQPHGMDVAGVDKSVRGAVGIAAEMHGGVECVGKAVFKHPCQLRIGQQGLDSGYFRLDGVGSEQAGVDGRTLRDIDSGIVGAALR